MSISKIKSLKVLSLLLFIALSFNTHESNKDNDLTKMELKGKVKSLREITFEVEDKFGQIKKVKSVNDVEYFFDLKGNIIKEQKYNQKGVPDFIIKSEFDSKANRIKSKTIMINNFLSSKTIYGYDETNKLIHEKEYDSNGDINSKTLYSYSNDKLSEIVKYNYNKEDRKFEIWDKTTYEYNQYGLMSQEIYETFFLKQSIDKTDYLYNDKGKLIEKNYINGSLREFDTKSQYVYNEKEELIELRMYGNNEPWIEKYSYNQGNLIELLIEKYKNAKLNETILKNYSFDKNGNWINSKSFKNDIPIYLRERNIQYYVNK